MAHKPPLFAFLPTTTSAKEAELFRKIHSRYCAAGPNGEGRAAHACVGRVTIDRLGLTFNCPRCGDARSLFPEEVRDQGSGTGDQDAAAEGER